FSVAGERRAPLVNCSGGTEVSGGLLGCTTWTPIKPTSFSGPVPGIAVDVVDERGRSVRGAVGELVVRKPWPGMTRGFWHAPEHYLATYWQRFPDVWVREIADKVMELLGRPLRPDAVRFVTDLPKTRNAKVLRRVIRGAYLGNADLGDLSALENPAAVDRIRELVSEKVS